jgi:hypothetical protein
VHLLERRAEDGRQEQRADKAALFHLSSASSVR